MDVATLITIITMFIVTDTSSEFVKYDGLGECLKDKRIIERKNDIKNKMPDSSGSLKLGGTAKSLTEKKKKSGLKVLTKGD